MPVYTRLARMSRHSVVTTRAALLALSSLLAASPALAATPLDPFASNDGAIPPKSAYSGPLFTLSHDYPATPKSPQPMPWREAIHNGPITTHNAAAYVQALKDYVGPDMRVLLEDYAHWDAAARGWYNEPWLGSLRESIHGTYVGTDDFPKDQFAGTGLTEDFSTYVLTYYDHTAAVPLAKVWGKTAMTPTIDTKANQFPGGRGRRQGGPHHRQRRCLAGRCRAPSNGRSTSRSTPPRATTKSRRSTRPR